jgi:hypothetical protein
MNKKDRRFISNESGGLFLSFFICFSICSLFVAVTSMTQRVKNVLSALIRAAADQDRSGQSSRLAADSSKPVMKLDIFETPDFSGRETPDLPGREIRSSRQKIPFIFGKLLILSRACRHRRAGCFYVLTCGSYVT